MPRFRPNMSCCIISSARPIRRSSARSASTCARRRACMAAGRLFHAGEFDMSATVKAYYALKIIGDDIDAPHMKRARDAILRARRRRDLQRLHPHHAGALSPGAVARHPGHAGGDLPPAALVPVPPVEGVLLVAHGDRAAADPDGAEAGRGEPAQGRYPRAVPGAAGGSRRATCTIPPDRAGATSCCGSIPRSGWPSPSSRARRAARRSTRRCPSSPSG